jgi:hypothetical protein
MMRPLKLLSLLLAILLLATGCTASYWNSFFKTSGIQGSVTTKGKITWDQVEQEDGSTIFQVTKTAPVLSVSLIPGSSPVDLQNLEVLYFSPLGGEEGGIGQLEDLYAAMPFATRLQGETPTTISLGQIITNQLIDATNPDSGNKIPEIDIEAVATFRGRDQLGNSTTWQVSVPISIEIE